MKMIAYNLWNDKNTCYDRNARKWQTNNSTSKNKNIEHMPPPYMEKIPISLGLATLLHICRVLPTLQSPQFLWSLHWALHWALSYDWSLLSLECLRFGRNTHISLFVTLLLICEIIPTPQSPILPETPSRYPQKLRVSANVAALRDDIVASKGDCSSVSWWFMMF